MIKRLLIAICLVAASSANAWDWFGLAPYDEADTNRPPRLHRLLENANDLMEEAEEEAVNGEGDKAITLYKDALAELERVERENPDRAEKPEFAPLRNKKATCAAAIESIRFAQVNDNLRAITVSDSAALRKKYNKKHGIKDGTEDEEEKPEAEKSKEETKPKPETKPKSEEQPTKQVAKAEVEDESPKAVEEAPKKNDWRTSLKEAHGLVKARQYEAADEILASLLEERPSDLNALLLRAAAQCGMGEMEAGRRTLEKANRSHPKSYLPYYNLAYVTLDLGEGKSSAREYYTLGRTVGGPRDVRLEKRLGIVAKTTGGKSGKKGSAK